MTTRSRSGGWCSPPQDDGVTELWALLPADGAALIEAVLNSLGNAQTNDRTADQRRAAALCARHHNAKHYASWRVKGQPDGTREWASPTGHRYVVHTPDG